MWKFNDFLLFQIFGFLIGGLIPVLLTIIAQFYSQIHPIDEAVIHMVGAIAVFTLVLAISALCSHSAINLGHPKSRPFLKVVFLLQALFSIALIHILVIYTGGPISSVFAYSYLYMPSVIGFTYAGGLELLGASSLLWISFISNLFWLDPQKTFFRPVMELGHNTVSGSYNASMGFPAWLYAVIITIQLIVTSAIAVASRKKPSQ